MRLLRLEYNGSIRQLASRNKYGGVVQIPVGLLTNAADIIMHNKNLEI